MKLSYTEMGYNIGQLVLDKNEAYGSSFAKSGDFLRLLFPQGVPPERFDDALLLVRIWDKLMRVATDRDAFGESPYRDIAGYGLLGAVMHEERKSNTCGTASADADSKPKETPASAPQPASPATTKNGKSWSGILPEKPSSPPRAVSSLKEGLEAAFAPAATEAAPRNEEGPKGFEAKRLSLAVMWQRRNDRCGCAYCCNIFGPLDRYAIIHKGQVVYIHDDCRRRFVEKITRWGFDPKDFEL